jgi:uncharacterized membrane protein YcjF (UPF0283 family)
MLDGTPHQTVAAREPFDIDDAPDAVVAPIATAPEAALPAAQTRLRVPSAAVFLGLSVASAGIAFMLASVRSPWIGLFGYASLLLFVAAFVVALVRALVSLVTLAMKATGHSAAATRPTLATLAGNLLMVLLGAGIAFHSTHSL